MPDGMKLWSGALFSYAASGVFFEMSKFQPGATASTSAMALALATAIGATTPAMAGGSLKDFAPAPRFSWTGFYVGAHVGGSFPDVAVTDFDVYNDPPAIEHNDSDVIAGGHIGYNWQSGVIVYGLEGELGYLGLDSSEQFSPFIGDPARIGDSIASTEGGIYGTITGRIGYAFETVLVYAKGGAAFARAKASYVDPNPTGAVLNSGTTKTEALAGYTVGGGLEIAMSRNWTLKGEYLYMDVGDIEHTALSGAVPFDFEHDIDVHSVKAAISYKF